MCGDQWVRVGFIEELSREGTKGGIKHHDGSRSIALGGGLSEEASIAEGIGIKEQKFARQCENLEKRFR